jgi:hypothetical protein
VQNREEALLRLVERAPMRCQVGGPERRLLLRPERLPFPTLLQRLLQAPEQRPLRGQGLPPQSGEWAHRGNSKFKMQSAKSRNHRKGNDLEPRRTMYGVRMVGPCYVLGLWVL